MKKQGILYIAAGVVLLLAVLAALIFLRPGREKARNGGEVVPAATVSVPADTSMGTAGEPAAVPTPAPLPAEEQEFLTAAEAALLARFDGRVAGKAESALCEEENAALAAWDSGALPEGLPPAAGDYLQALADERAAWQATPEDAAAVYGARARRTQALLALTGEYADFLTGRADTLAALRREAVLMPKLAEAQRDAEAQLAGAAPVQENGKNVLHLSNGTEHTVSLRFLVTYTYPDGREEPHTLEPGPVAPGAVYLLTLPDVAPNAGTPRWSITAMAYDAE